uniref:FAD-binding oxidoreductase n=1 Tax=Paractinoplanes polyasparticus TaxID=2856853 RepID=UPI001C850FDD|nr:FAD-binding oxidoreductase [Actinoplanes polyasparticus]
MNAISPADLAGLRSEVAGPVLTPDDAGYTQELSTFNLAVTHAPLVAVGAQSPADVQAAVRFATAHNLPVAVLSAGHGSSVSSAGSVLITTRRLSGLTVDENARTARVEAGVRWAELIERTGKLGLGALNGSSPTVSVIGYTLGGGLGPFGRRYGYAADHVWSLDVVTADGELRHVTADGDPDLFWALRGAKGNFGVVVAMEFTLFPIASFYGGGLFLPGELAAKALHLFREWVAGLPEEMTASVCLLSLPPAPFVPEPLRGRRVVHLRFAYLGDAAEGARLVEPFRRLGEPIIDAVTELPYAAVAAVHNDPVDPMPIVEQATLLRELPAEAVDTFLRFAADERSPLVMAELRHLGGALGRPPAIPNAVGNREAAFTVFAAAVGGPEDAPRLHAYEEAFVNALKPWSTGRRYANFMFAGDTDPETVALAYPDDSFRRLRDLKHRFDPANTFRINHNIVAGDTREL